MCRLVTGMPGTRTGIFWYFLRARHYPSLFNTLGNLVSPFIIPILQVRDLTPREVKSMLRDAQGKWQS